jgi:hypothetical protein
MGGAAERRAARGRKNHKKKHEPSFSGKKTKNLRFRVFFASLVTNDIQHQQLACGQLLGLRQLGRQLLSEGNSR